MVIVYLLINCYNFIKKPLQANLFTKTNCSGSPTTFVGDFF